MKKRILKIYGITLGVGLIYYVWIRLTGLAIPCLSYEMTGFFCPGCGSSRLFLRLGEFNISGAFNANPALFVLLVFWNIVALLCFVGRPKFVSDKRFLYTCLFISIAVLLGFCLIRNIT